METSGQIELEMSQTISLHTIEWKVGRELASDLIGPLKRIRTIIYLFFLSSNCGPSRFQIQLGRFRLKIARLNPISPSPLRD